MGGPHLLAVADHHQVGLHGVPLGEADVKGGQVDAAALAPQGQRHGDVEGSHHFLVQRARCRDLERVPVDDLPAPLVLPACHLFVAHARALGLVHDWDTDENWTRFTRWEDSACAHELYFREHIGNWPSVRLFQDAAALAGLPELVELLPGGNGGLVPLEEGRRALEALARFRALPEVGTGVALVDAESGSKLQVMIERYEGIFQWGGDDVDYGLRRVDFFARRRSAEEVLFRSC